ncbi:Nn.00g093720.m01.CDS01 [Neocucurbitaria sp. VM-36]
MSDEYVSYDYMFALRNGYQKPGRDHDTVLLMALETYIKEAYKSAELEVTDRVIDDMAGWHLKHYNTLRTLRDKPYSGKDAWERCEASMRNQLWTDFSGALRKKGKTEDYAQGSFKGYMKGFEDYMEREFSAGLNSFSGMASALPKHGRGSLFDEDERERRSQERSRMHVRTVEDSRHRGSRPHGESYCTEVRHPAKSSHVTPKAEFYRSKECRPTVKSYQYSSSSASNSPLPSARGPYNVEVRTPGSVHPSYTVREIRPGGTASSQLPQNRARHPAPPSSQYSYYDSIPRPPYPSHHHPTPPSAASIQPGLNLYAVLGVLRSASEAEIMKAWKKCSLKYHPDKLPEADRKEATEKIQEINNAKDVLLDEKMRAQYDRTGRIPSSLNR